MRIAEKKKSQITALYEQCSNLPVDVGGCGMCRASDDEPGVY